MDNMAISIIVSKTDLAGLNIYSCLKENFSFKETPRIFDSNPVLSYKNFDLVLIEREQVFADYVDSLSSDLFIFASKHRSEQGKPCLTVHPIGNFGKAELGGKDFELVPANASVMKSLLLELSKKKEEKKLSDYEVCLECSHHGPFLSKPTLFIELGSSPEQWKDKKAAEAIAETIISSSVPAKNSIVSLGIGGPHYAPNFTKLELNSNYAFSHIIPKYFLQNFSLEVLNKMISSTIKPVQEIVLDAKGLAQEKQKIISILKKQSIPFKTTKEL
ncbi:MAG: D-aminoacyl-tRNA deacylase [Candidatus Diapherotrites archaeon]